MLLALREDVAASPYFSRGGDNRNRWFQTVSISRFRFYFSHIWKKYKYGISCCVKYDNECQNYIMLSNDTFGPQSVLKEVLKMCKCCLQIFKYGLSCC